MVDTEKQKEYQKKYDKKTKMVSVKYVLSEMDDYDRLMVYLRTTGKSANSFIKELINNFFDNDMYVINRRTIADYFVDYNVSGELLNELKEAVGKDKYMIILERYKNCIYDELDSAYNNKGDSFDEWIEEFLSDIKCGDIEINVSDDEFMKLIDTSMSGVIGEVTCYY